MRGPACQLALTMNLKSTCAKLKCLRFRSLIFGIWSQTDLHTHASRKLCSHASVGRAQALPNHHSFKLYMTSQHTKQNRTGRYWYFSPCVEKNSWQTCKSSTNQIYPTYILPSSHFYVCQFTRPSFSPRSYECLVPRLGDLAYS